MCDRLSDGHGVLPQLYYKGRVFVTNTLLNRAGLIQRVLC